MSILKEKGILDSWNRLDKFMPFIEDEIWDVYKHYNDFVLVGIDKGESLEIIAKLIWKDKFSIYS